MNNILNIVNFIRAAEPRDRSIDLLEPVKNQIRLMKENNLPGTFLVQYDSMCREDILELLLPLDPDQFELGIWLEMNEPHCKAAGLPWRGRPGFEWDWHAHCGFSVGYTPAERELLVDVTFEKFEQIFRRKPKSVGSWMLDAHTIGYLAKKGVVATCICRDQWGTDGYTIWGGYWNQGYYPSKFNALCPAQSDENQIKLPVLRMLGSDPVTQYDLGLRIDEGPSSCQKVETLEPIYPHSGGSSEWVEWFMRQYYGGGCLAFAYAQAGQENSFGWNKMKKGLEFQFPHFAKWRAEGKLRIEPMYKTGEWFLERFDKTPATSVSSLERYGNEQAQSVWYDCKNYRTNVYGDKNGIRLRDVFLFDEAVKERYLTKVCETEYLVYDNLPVMDGNRMSGSGILAGAWLVKPDSDERIYSDLTVTERENALIIDFDGGKLDIGEQGITLNGAGLHFMWNRERSPFIKIDEGSLLYRHNVTDYRLRVEIGSISAADEPILMPMDGVLKLTFERES